ncbi:macro domain-containing protein [Halomarina pelagica]|uniref:macro domain-containing protein n=1 Tax=Halomarina pelagica TaxID=2961599 RepID=UPI0020C31676|nr:macro domain-containing protein [Halomarina sp. BND7]
MEFTVEEGDVAREDVDAVVNAANTGLAMGSGVAGALRRAGGEALAEAAVAKGPIELGGAVETDGFDLPADYVVHAAAMPAGGRATAESVREATRSSLKLADDLGCTSVAVPILGTGAAGFDLREGARIVCEEVRAFEPAALSDVRVVAYGQEAYDVLREVAEG